MQEKAAGEAQAAAVESGKDNDAALPEPEQVPTSRVGKLLYNTKKAVMHGTSVDIHTSVKEDPLIAQLHERAEVFNPQAESVFGYLQVSMCRCFPHVVVGTCCNRFIIWCWNSLCVEAQAQCTSLPLLTEVQYERGSE